MKNDDTPVHANAEYVHGQVLALRAVVLALAELTTDRDSLQARALIGIERIRAVLLPEPVSELQVAGLDEVEKWLKDATS